MVKEHSVCREGDVLLQDLLLQLFLLLGPVVLSPVSRQK